ncbi:hypothetical protein BT96DRAFT_419216 [Gymnopus androsaceus JB14]|uniref:Uncharacterized protein n=1 Tax=Gymnopus androsaceus JB14 TaxID=1447944 RepID=A0A6A4I167_9AGAR|nr:hypothetical protein BT96DRAFT_419216 [Gymnopus androsaceus JB14]
MASFKRQSSFQLRTSVDFAEIRRRLRSEHGPAIQFDAETLTDVDKDLDNCDAEVHHLQSRIVFLQNQRRLLQDYKNCLQSLRSPIRRLPNETFLRIFDFACEMNELTSPKVQDIPALVISGVCSRWRDLSKAHPCLWSRIRLHFQSTTRHLPTDALMNTFIDSSQQCPLTLEFPAKTLGELEAHQQHLCAVLGGQKPRWKQVKIEHRAVFDALIAQGPSHFPILEQLLIPALQASLQGDIQTVSGGSKSEGPVRRQTSFAKCAQLYVEPTYLPLSRSIPRRDKNHL